MAFERKYEIPFEHLSEETRGIVSAIRRTRKARAISGVASVIAGIATALILAKPKPSEVGIKELAGATGFATAGASMYYSNEAYKGQLITLAARLREKPLLAAAYTKKHPPEQQLRSNYSHLFVRGNGNVVLTNEPGAKFIVRGLKRTRVGLVNLHASAPTRRA
ncbi:MAG: hypothetical protein AB1626_01085 [Candidatus Micrarchaeota archaeon]